MTTADGESNVLRAVPSCRVERFTWLNLCQFAAFEESFKRTGRSSDDFKNPSARKKKTADSSRSLFQLVRIGTDYLGVCSQEPADSASDVFCSVITGQPGAISAFRAV